MESITCLCADIGGSFIEVGTVDSLGTVSGRSVRQTPTNDLGMFLDVLREMMDGIPPAPLNICIAGVIDPHGGACQAANIPCLSGVVLDKLLSESLGRSVRIANDADCFALGEARYGAVRGHETVFGVILGTGLGGGLVHNGKILTGKGGFSGEWGHGPFVREGTGIPCFPCACGQMGCVETIGSARGLERLYGWCGGADLPCEEIVACWLAGERRARKAIGILTDYVSAALANVVNITGATALPVGGGLSNVEALVDTLDTAVRARVLRDPGQRLVMRGMLGNDAALLGAATLCQT